MLAETARPLDQFARSAGSRERGQHERHAIGPVNPQAAGEIDDLVHKARCFRVRPMVSGRDMAGQLLQNGAPIGISLGVGAKNTIDGAIRGAEIVMSYVQDYQAVGQISMGQKID